MLRIGIRTQEMQSTINQMSQGVDSTSAIIIRLLKQQHDSLENLSTQSPVDIPEIPRRSQPGCSEGQKSPLRTSYGRSETEDNSSSLILENRVLPTQRKILRFISSLLTETKEVLLYPPN